MLLLDWFCIRVWCWGDAWLLVALWVESTHVLIVPSEDIYILLYKTYQVFFFRGDKISLMKMRLGLASFPRLIWITLSSVGGSRYSKRMSQRVFKCLMQGSVSDSIISLVPSLSSSSKWLVEIMFTKRLLKMAPTLISDSHDDVPDEWSWLTHCSGSESDKTKVDTAQSPSSHMIIVKGLSLLVRFLSRSSSQIFGEVLSYLLHHTMWISSVMREL